MKTQLVAPLQLDQKIIINASVNEVWDVFNDQSVRTKWTGDVQSIEYKYKNTTVGETTITNCIVNGKKGTLHTKCLALNPNSRGEFIVEKDTFGITNMLLNMSFAVECRELHIKKTEFRMQSHYSPKNYAVKLTNGVIKKKMGKEVDLLLLGLKDYIENGQVNLLNPINQE